MKQRFVPILLALCVLVGALSTAVLAAGPSGPAPAGRTAQTDLSESRFTDVEPDHWARSYIETVAAGGLMGGYGGGRFGPEDALNIDQMAAIICRAKGVPGEKGGDGYWACGFVRNCIETGYLPDFGPITTERYSVSCSRELAVYMMTKSLGASNSTRPVPGLTIKSIPDYEEISPRYAPTILRAYQIGLVAGADAKRTFRPREPLTRAQVCAILGRAGYTEKKETPTVSPNPGKDNGQLVKAFREKTEFSCRELDGVFSFTAQDPIYGGLCITFRKDGSSELVLHEEYGKALLRGDLLVDAYGNKIPDKIVANDYIDPKTGKVVLASAWSYEGRQLARKVFQEYFPTEYQEAYDAMVGVMRQELHEVPQNALPSAIRWIEGRAFRITLDQERHTMNILLGAPNDQRIYQESMAGTGVGKSEYRPKHGTVAGLDKLYELHKG